MIWLRVVSNDIDYSAFTSCITCHCSICITDLYMYIVTSLWLRDIKENYNIQLNGKIEWRKVPKIWITYNYILTSDINFTKHVLKQILHFCLKIILYTCTFTYRNTVSSFIRDRIALLLEVIFSWSIHTLCMHIFSILCYSF